MTNRKDSLAYTRGIGSNLILLIMKAAIAFAAASAAVAHAVATPASLGDKPAKRGSSLPAVTVKGNGMIRVYGRL